MTIEHFILGMYQANSYILSKDGKALVIDAGEEAARLKEYLDINQLSLEMVLLTHGHLDHAGAVDDLLELCGPAPVYLHASDRALIDDHTPVFGPLKAPSQALSEGMELSFAGETIRVIHTPGHTPGGCCFLIGDDLFTGDTLFKHTVGRTDLVGGSTPAIIKSITEKLYKLDPEVVVYPGHNSPTTIGHEKKYNMFVKDHMKK